MLDGCPVVPACAQRPFHSGDLPWAVASGPWPRLWDVGSTEPLGTFTWIQPRPEQTAWLFRNEVQGSGAVCAGASWEHAWLTREGLLISGPPCGPELGTAPPDRGRARRQVLKVSLKKGGVAVSRFLGTQRAVLSGRPDGAAGGERPGPGLMGPSPSSVHGAAPAACAASTRVSTHTGAECVSESQSGFTMCQTPNRNIVFHLRQSYLPVIKIRFLSKRTF